MKVLVTGACGFIGSHMVETAAAAGHEVIAADLRSALDAATQDRTRFPEVCRAAGARLFAMDLTDIDSVKRAVEAVEVVFHIAAVFDYTAPESVLRAVNVEGTRNLFDALAADGNCRRVVNWGRAASTVIRPRRTRRSSRISPSARTTLTCARSGTKNNSRTPIAPAASK